MSSERARTDRAAIGTTRTENELAGLAEAASGDAPETIEKVLVTARQTLGMDVSFVSEIAGGRQVYRSLDGDAASFGFSEGGSVALEDSFCRLMVAGRLPNVIPDASADDRIKDLAVRRRARIGAYVGVPLRFSDGRLYGTICSLSHSPEPSLRERDAQFMVVLARLVAEQLEREEVQRRALRAEVRAAGIGALLAALEARDGYTGGHSQAVVELSRAVARRMGLAEAEVADVEQAALLHDVGKVGTPDRVLRKPGPLDESEWAAMKAHTEIGERLSLSVADIAHLAPIIRAEHERWDGNGYPDGLAGEEIPLASRIILACDAYHAMTSDRPYRSAIGAEAAREELRRNAGTQFCPHTVEALLGVLRLRDDEGRA